MKKTIWIVVFLMSTMSAGVCSASEISNASLHRLLKDAGLDVVVQQIPPLVRSSIERARQQVVQRAEQENRQPQVSDSEFRAYESAALSAFQPSDLLKAITTSVRGHISEEDARKILVWYSSPIGKQINQAEENAGTLQAIQQMRATARQLLADKPLVQYAKEMDKVTHQTDMAMKMREDTAVAMFVASSSLRYPNQPPPIKAFKRSIEAKLNQARPNFEMTTIISLAYTYKNIDKASRQKYLTFLETPRAQRFVKYANGGLLQGWAEATARMGKAIAAQAKSQHA